MSYQSRFNQSSFRHAMHHARKEAILEECTRFLSAHGYDAMTLDQVAEATGIAKAVIYKHFKSKEEMCCEVMARGLENAQQFLQALPSRMAAYQKLMSFVRWILNSQFTSDAPLIAERRSGIRAALQLSSRYQEELQQLEDMLDKWILQAQQAGNIHPEWPVLLIRKMFLTRTVDPMIDTLRATGIYTQEETVEWGVQMCMNTLQTAPSPYHIAKNRSRKTINSLYPESIICGEWSVQGMRLNFSAANTPLH